MYIKSPCVVKSYLRKFEMSKISIFSLIVMAFALLLLSTLAAGELLLLDEGSCTEYLLTELYIACNDQYKNSSALQRTKRGLSSRNYEKLADCCINPCHRATFLSHCADYTYDADKDIAQIAVSTPLMARNLVNSIFKCCNALKKTLNHSI